MKKFFALLALFVIPSLISALLITFLPLWFPILPKLAVRCFCWVLLGFVVITGLRKMEAQS